MCHEIGQESGVRKKRPPRSDPFDVECLVSDRPSALAETFTATDGSTYIEMTDGVNFWGHPPSKHHFHRTSAPALHPLLPAPPEI